MKKKHCFQEFIRYTFLNVMGMIGLSCYILADTFFISKGLGGKRPCGAESGDTCL